MTQFINMIPLNMYWFLMFWSQILSQYMSSKQSCPTIIYVSIIVWYNRFERKIFSCSLSYSPSMHTIKPQPSMETPQIIGNLKFYFNLVFHVILHIKNTYQVHKVSNKYSKKKRFITVQNQQLTTGISTVTLHPLQSLNKITSYP